MTTEPEAGPTPEGLFRDHYPRLVRGLAVGGGLLDDAAEAVQEAFIGLCLRWEKVKGYEDPVAWVRRVAINRYLRRRRSIQRRGRALARMGPDVATVEEDPSGRLDLERSLARLPLQQRIAVGLHYVSGLSVVETAQAMGLAKGTVDSHLHRARNTLRPTLEVDR